MWILVVDCGCCVGLWLLWLMLVHVHVHVYQVLLLSWHAKATLHQVSCDLGRGVYVPLKPYMHAHFNKLYRAYGCKANKVQRLKCIMQERLFNKTKKKKALRLSIELILNLVKLSILLMGLPLWTR